MLELIRRNAVYVDGYKEYCQEFWDHETNYFRPTNPELIDENWFERTKSWHDKKELGLIPGQPVSFHYWAVDGDNFVGEFQLRTELPEKVMTGIGRDRHLEKVLMTINDQNTVSAHICEKLGGVLMYKITAYNKYEGSHIMRRYWISLKGEK